MEDIISLGHLLPDFLTQILVAIVCGGLIGLGRGISARSAGLRDNILICVGAAIYMIIATILGVEGSDQRVIAASLVALAAGIIGSGMVINLRGESDGLNAAATLWLVAAIGLVVGAGYPLLAMLLTGVILLTMTLLRGVERQFGARQRRLLLKLTVREDSPELRRELKTLLERYQIQATSFRAERSPIGVKLTLEAADEPDDIRPLITELWTMRGITEVEH